MLPCEHPGLGVGHQRKLEERKWIRIVAFLAAVVVVDGPHAIICVAIHARKAGGKTVGRWKGGIIG